MSPRTFTHSLRDFAMLFRERFVATHCTQVAGSLTYTTLLALVPVITVTSIIAFAFFPNTDPSGDAFKAFMLENVLPEKLGHVVFDYVVDFKSKATRLGVIGIIMLTATSLMLLATVERVFNRIWGVRKPRPILLRITVYWLVLTLGPIILVGSVFATAYLLSIQWSPELDITWLGVVLARLGAPLLLAAFFVFLYFAVPNHKVKLRHAAIGGLLAAVVFFLMQRAFVIIIARFTSYTLVYGTFAALPIFLVWLYASWIVVLMGALVSATMPAFAERRRVVSAFPGCEAWSAVTMLVQLAHAQQQGHPVGFEALRERAPLSEHQAEAVLGRLAEAGWVSRTDEGDWVLTRAPTQIPLSEIVRRFALDITAWRAASGVRADSPGENVVDRLEAVLCLEDQTLAELATSQQEQA